MIRRTFAAFALGAAIIAPAQAQNLPDELLGITGAFGVSRAALAEPAATAAPTNASAAVTGREWTPIQLSIAVAAVAFTIIDHRQSVALSRSNLPGHAGPVFTERAKITKAVIGERPSERDVDLWMLATTVGFLAAAHYAPAHRTSILGIWAGTRLAVILNNDRIGLSFSGTLK